MVTIYVCIRDALVRGTVYRGGTRFHLFIWHEAIQRYIFPNTCGWLCMSVVAVGCKCLLVHEHMSSRVHKRCTLMHVPLMSYLE